MAECINKCTPYEYENPLSPKPTESDLVQVYDSIGQITNPNSNHIYVVGNDVYVFDGVSFVSISGCDIPVYAGEYTVTAPSDGDLVLPTKDKLMEDDVTIKANHEIEDALLTGDFPNEVYHNDRIVKLKASAFQDVGGIKVINLPNLTNLGGSCLSGISDVEEIYTPKVSGRYYNGAYRNNPNLRVLDYGSIYYLNLMGGCPKLEVLILRSQGVVNTSFSFDSTAPLGKDGVGGYVYVPQSLLEQYQASTEWQTNAHVLEFRPIEGSEYEIEGLESTSNSIQSFSLNSPLNDTFDEPLETFDTPLEDEFIPTEELESEE